MDDLTVVGHITQVETCFGMSCSGAGDNLPQNRSHGLLRTVLLRKDRLGCSRTREDSEKQADHSTWSIKTILDILPA